MYQQEHVIEYFPAHLVTNFKMNHVPSAI